MPKEGKFMPKKSFIWHRWNAWVSGTSKVLVSPHVCSTVERRLQGQCYEEQWYTLETLKTRARIVFSCLLSKREMVSYYEELVEQGSNLGTSVALRWFGLKKRVEDECKKGSERESAERDITMRYFFCEMHHGHN